MDELALSILDLAANSQRAGADKIEIDISVFVRRDRIEISIADNGCGIASEDIKRATDPFYTTRTTRKVGMGLALFSALCEQCEGSMEIQSVHRGESQSEDKGKNRCNRAACLGKKASDCQNGENCVESQSGTRISASLRLSSINRPPLGDMGSTMIALISGCKNTRCILRYLCENREFVFDTDAVSRKKGEDTYENDTLIYLCKMINENIENINGGFLTI